MSNATISWKEYATRDGEGSVWLQYYRRKTSLSVERMVGIRAGVQGRGDEIVNKANLVYMPEKLRELGEVRWPFPLGTRSFFLVPLGPDADQWPVARAVECCRMWQG
jgi:hypothetical protein